MSYIEEDIFLDIRPDKSFYTLDLNPQGTVNIKIIRNEDNRITGAVYMTDEEVAQLLEGEYDAEGDEKGNADDEEGNEDGRIWHPQVMPETVSFTWMT